MSFGRPSDAEEPLAQAEPIVIDLGGGLKFRLAGQIDRIDQVGESDFEVIDYKTGGYWDDDWRGTFGGGTKAAACALRARRRRDAQAERQKSHGRPAASTTSRAPRAGRRVKAIPTQSAATVRGVLGDLRQVIASGLFVHAADESACKWCDYGPACGSKARASAPNARSRIGICSSPTESWWPMSNQLVDEQSRQRIKSELQRNQLVEAGAGSGKTQMMAARMAAGVAGGDYVVRHMAAVTFTRKAAAELRGRFQLALEKELKTAAGDRRAPSAFATRCRTSSDSSPARFTPSARTCCASGRSRPACRRVSPSWTRSKTPGSGAKAGATIGPSSRPPAIR